MTIEDLAILVKKGFDQTATKQDLVGLATKSELHELRKDITERLDAIEDDIRDLKIAVGPLVKIVAALETDVRNLHVRLGRVERKMGFAK